MWKVWVSMDWYSSRPNFCQFLFLFYRKKLLWLGNSENLFEQLLSKIAYSTCHKHCKLVNFSPFSFFCTLLIGIFSLCYQVLLLFLLLFYLCLQVVNFNFFWIILKYYSIYFSLILRVRLPFLLKKTACFQKQPVLWKQGPCFFFIFFWNAAVFWGILPSAVFLAVTGKMRIQQKINRT